MLEQIAESRGMLEELMMALQEMEAERTAREAEERAREATEGTGCCDRCCTGCTAAFASVIAFGMLVISMFLGVVVIVWAAFLYYEDWEHGSACAAATSTGISMHNALIGVLVGKVVLACVVNPIAMGRIIFSR